jgi:hypothetical protein
MDWRRYAQLADCENIDVPGLRRAARERADHYGVFPESVQALGWTLIFIAAGMHHEKELVVFGKDSELLGRFTGAAVSGLPAPARACPLNHANCRQIRALFPFTAPVSQQERPVSLGLGDRLGLASPGHIQLIRDYDIFPVLAQQSMRELNLTGRNYDDVLDAASWAVFQEGYEAGFGADGDHLKTAAEVRMALDCGFSMITLDCSEHIDNEAASLSAEAAAERYSQLPASERERLERIYAGRRFEFAGGTAFDFPLQALHGITLVYHRAISHAAQIYHDVIVPADRPVDFEISIDETLTPTSPAAHYFVASELLRQNVRMLSLAPRFCGEFQKGVDYRGDIAQFTAEFAVHVKIAEQFGYKVSVHSGSDKFSVFPIIGAATGGRFHLKTAGTNWLEAVRLIAAIDPALYRRIHQFALDHLDAARRYYHISADSSRVPALASLSDQELPALMDQDDARQILHITYGLILQAKNPDGAASFRDAIFALLYANEQDYRAYLVRHIGRHVRKLGINPAGG